MERKTTKFLFGLLAMALTTGVLSPRPAQALVDVCNTAYMDWDAEPVASPFSATYFVASGSTCFSAESDPILSLVKVRDPASGPRGTVVTFDLAVAYPKIVDLYGICGDDSQALNVTLTDPVPPTFTYVANSILVSTDGTFDTEVAGTDAADGLADPSGYDVTFAGGTMTAIVPTINEGVGDGTCVPATPPAVMVRFQATKN